MKRIVYVPNSYGLSNKKYVLREEYGGFGIYQEKCPAGYFVCQSWLVYNGNIGYISESYNNRCKEELLDSIDKYNETGKFGLHGFMAKKEDNIYGEHSNNRSYSF